MEEEEDEEAEEKEEEDEGKVQVDCGILRSELQVNTAGILS